MSLAQLTGGRDASPAFAALGARPLWQTPELVEVDLSVSTESHLSGVSTDSSYTHTPS